MKLQNPGTILLLMALTGFGSYMLGYSLGGKHKEAVVNQAAVTRAFEAARMRCFIHWHDQALGKQYHIDPD